MRATLVAMSKPTRIRLAATTMAVFLAGLSIAGLATRSHPVATKAPAPTRVPSTTTSASTTTQVVPANDDESEPGDAE